jgi:PiT family inorganic phosphate transporter
VDVKFISSVTILAALASGITWNLITWYYGLPSSSSHALFGGLCGAALASAHGNWQVIKWSTGLWPKVVKPMFLAPGTGFLLGFLVMTLLMLSLRRVRPRLVNLLFGKAQLLSAAWMSFEHGRNDAQKTMGIIALTLFTASSQQGTFDKLPSWLSFLRLSEFRIDLWIQVTCAITMAAGTAVGGWKIIKTPRQAYGQTAADPRLRRSIHRRCRHRFRDALGYSSLDHARHLQLHHGRWVHQRL